MRAPVRIPFPRGQQALRLERNEAGRHDPVGSWCLWLHAAADFTQGTYLKMFDDGTIERVTLYADGSEDVFTVKDKDRVQSSNSC